MVCKVCHSARSWWPVASGQWPVGGAPTVCKLCHSTRRTRAPIRCASCAIRHAKPRPATGHRRLATVCKVCNSGCGPDFHDGPRETPRIPRAVAGRLQLECQRIAFGIGDLPEHLRNDRIANGDDPGVGEAVDLGIGGGRSGLKGFAPFCVQPLARFVAVHQKLSQAASCLGLRTEWHSRSGASTRRQPSNRRSYRSVR